MTTPEFSALPRVPAPLPWYDCREDSKDVAHEGVAVVMKLATFPAILQPQYYVSRLTNFCFEDIALKIIIPKPKQ